MAEASVLTLYNNTTGEAIAPRTVISALSGTGKAGQVVGFVSENGVGVIDLDAKLKELLPRRVYVTLTTAGWDASNNQSVTVSGAKADTTAQLILLYPDKSIESTYHNCGVDCTGQSEGHLTFNAGTKPTVALGVTIIIIPLVQG